MAKPSSLPASMRLFRAIICPYAQRAGWALQAYKFPHEIVEIDLANKPEWYPQVNPKGKVPALELKDGKILIESLVILWYLEELAAKEGKGLLPTDPYARAHIRLSIATFESSVIPTVYNAVRNTDPAQKSQLNEAILSGLQEFLSTVPADKPFNPFLTIATFPWIERLKGVAYWRDFELPKTQEYERLRKWIEETEKDESYLKARADESAMIESFKKFAKEKI
ncbi:thioredoxin-like protein [Gaertneriomyces semiglobifer]|nr:thioredoxin-like protein [Gaertneriomyces semiglobifer]